MEQPNHHAFEKTLNKDRKIIGLEKKKHSVVFGSERCGGRIEGDVPLVERECMARTRWWWWMTVVPIKNMVDDNYRW